MIPPKPGTQASTVDEIPLGTPVPGTFRSVRACGMIVFLAPPASLAGGPQYNGAFCRVSDPVVVPVSAGWGGAGPLRRRQSLLRTARDAAGLPPIRNDGPATCRRTDVVRAILQKTAEGSIFAWRELQRLKTSETSA